MKFKELGIIGRMFGIRCIFKGNTAQQVCPVALSFPSHRDRSEECVVWSYSERHLCWPTAPSHKNAVLVHWENECDYAGHDARHTVETQNTAGGSDFVTFPSKWSFITWDLFIYLFWKKRPRLRNPLFFFSIIVFLLKLCSFLINQNGLTIPSPSFANKCSQTH